MADPVSYEREKDPTTMSALLLYCENQLGWLPPERGWRGRQLELSKLKSTMKRTRVDLETLWRAAHWCWRTRTPIETPSALAYLVDELDDQVEEQRPLDVDVEAEIQLALDLEERERAPGWTDRMGRLVRARGAGRTDALEAWKEARGE